MSMVYDEYLLFYHRKLACLERLCLLQFFFLQLDIFTTFPFKVLCLITLSHIDLLSFFI